MPIMTNKEKGKTAYILLCQKRLEMLEGEYEYTMEQRLAIGEESIRDMQPDYDARTPYVATPPFVSVYRKLCAAHNALLELKRIVDSRKPRRRVFKAPV